MKSFLKLFVVFILVLSQTEFSALPLNALTTTSSTNLYGGYHPLPTSATLTASSSSTYITSLQSLLTIKGYYNAAIDGVYGPATTSAVASFQAANNLAVDGVAGPKTIASLTGAAPATVSSSSTASSSVNVKTCAAAYNPVCGLIKNTVCNDASIVAGSVSSCVQTETRKTYDSLCELENTNSLFLYNGKCDLTKPLLTAIDTTGNSLTNAENMCVSGYEASCTQQIPVPCVKAPCGDDEISTLAADSCSVDQPVCGAPENYQDAAGVVRINNYKNKCQLNQAKATFLYNGKCDANQPDKALSALKATKAQAQVNASLTGTYTTNVPVIQNTTVAQLQSLFKILGYYTLPVDGVYGPATILAIEKYKASLGLLNSVIRTKGPDINDEVSTTSEAEVTDEP